LRAIVQRVSSASVSVEGQVCAAVGTGLLVLVGFSPEDAPADTRWMADKVAGLRVFADSDGKMNLSLGDVGGEALVVPNFTLYGDCRKGRRPGFDAAAKPDLAEPLFRGLCDALSEFVPVQRGIFAAHMHVSLTNDGPITLIVETARRS
jgi:D-aminoacyl-tRNA deacylase